MLRLHSILTVYRPFAACLTTVGALALLLTGAGCRSMSASGSGSFASVTIDRYSEAQIAETTARVFASNGYRGGRSGSFEMIFEKEASRGTSMAREGIAASQYGAQTINRVRVEIVPLAGGQHRLQCKAFMVTGGSDPFFQDEVPVSNIRRGPYQSMLNEVEKQLQ